MVPAARADTEHHQLERAQRSGELVARVVVGAGIQWLAASELFFERRYPPAAAHSTTTECSTLPWCMVWNAVSTSSRPMRSDTNLSSGSRPCR